MPFKFVVDILHTLFFFICYAGTSLAAKLLRKNGVTIFKVRDEIEKLLRKGNKFFLSPERPPLTGDAQRAIDWAADLAVKSGLCQFCSYIYCQIRSQYLYIHTAFFLIFHSVHDQLIFRLCNCCW